MKEFALISGTPEQKRQEFIRAEYTGSSMEVAVLISALADYATDKGVGMSAGEKQLAQDLYRRLLWCDHIIISFHSAANEPRRG